MHASSPLDGLDIPAIIQSINDNGDNEAVVLKKIIATLSQPLGNTAIAWQHALSVNPAQNIKDINYLSYTVQVALASLTYGANNVCLIDELGEMTIGRTYAKCFAQTHGTVKAMHWLPSVLLNDHDDNSVYFCKEMTDTLSHAITPSTVIENGVLTNNCHKEHDTSATKTTCFTESLCSPSAGLLFCTKQSGHSIKNKMVLIK